MKNPFTKPARHLAVLALAVFSLSAMAASAVPKEVSDAFAEKYGNPKEVEWDKNSSGSWEAQFEKEDGETYRSDFTRDGEWTETRHTVEFDDVPEAVRAAIEAENGDREIVEIERVESGSKGSYYEVEFMGMKPDENFEYTVEGENLAIFIDSPTPPAQTIDAEKSVLEDMTVSELLMEFGMNLVTILIYACGIYYLRHHDHKMMFLLLAFNLFLFPVFLLSSVLTMGFGFTIFALLALVQIRSENFDKAEVAYLLGAVALTFINSQLTVRFEIAASALVLITAFFADHPRLWRSAYQSTEIRYRVSEKDKVVDRDHLGKTIADEFGIIVNDIDIRRVDSKEVRMFVVYSEPDGKGFVRKRHSPKWQFWKRNRDRDGKSSSRGKTKKAPAEKS